MNEEMRKEFEEWFSVNKMSSFYGYSHKKAMQMAWQASREAMKPIEFPAEIELDLIGDQVAPTHQNSYAEGYNDALSDLELKITELGYKVEV